MPKYIKNGPITKLTILAMILIKKAIFQLKRFLVKTLYIHASKITAKISVTKSVQGRGSVILVIHNIGTEITFPTINPQNADFGDFLSKTKIKSTIASNIIVAIVAMAKPKSHAKSGAEKGVG